MNSKTSLTLKSFLIPLFPWLIAGLAIVAVIVTMTPRYSAVRISDEAWLNESPGEDTQQTLSPVASSALDHKSEAAEQTTDQQSAGSQLPVNPVVDSNVEPSGEVMESSATPRSANEPATGLIQRQRTSPDIETQSDSLPAPAAESGMAGVASSQDAQTSAGDTETASASITASGLTAGSASTKTNTGSSAARSGTAAVTATEAVPVATGKPRQEITRGDGAWVINLVSSTSKEDAGRFSAKAGAQGIDTGIVRATVKGTDYWRVQVPGFATADEAKAASVQIKEKLGLDAVWIVKQ
jgi:cell division septation protein DedD